MAQTPANYVFPGASLPYTGAGTEVPGQVIEVGTVPMIVETVDPNAATAMNLSSGGVWNVPKDTSTFSAGDAVYWDSNGSPVTGTASSGAATSTASGNNLMGLVTPLGAALTGDSYVQVLLTAAKRTTTIAGSVTADDITGSDSSLGIAGKAGNNGAGGAIVIAGGAGNNASAGGALTLRGGAGDGAANGAIAIGDANTVSVTFGVNPRIPVAAVVPGGTAIGNANALSEGFNLVTGADNTAAVILPASVAGKVVHVKSNTSGKILIVFPPVSSAINGASANAAYNHANLAIRTYYCYNSTLWLTDPETPT